MDRVGLAKVFAALSGKNIDEELQNQKLKEAQINYYNSRANEQDLGKGVLDIIGGLKQAQDVLTPKQIVSSSPTIEQGGPVSFMDSSTGKVNPEINKIIANQLSQRLGINPQEAIRQRLGIKSAKGQNDQLTNVKKIQLKRLAQQEAYKQLGGSMMVGLSDTKREQYKKLSDDLYKQYITEFSGGDNGNISTGKQDSEDNLMDTNW